FAFNPFLYLPRLLSAAFGVATVWGVAEIGKRAFEPAVGRVAALFLALACLHVRDSHFGVTDTPMTAMVIFAVLLILRWRQQGGVGRACVAGLITGLAGSMKYNGLGAASAFVAALALRVMESSDAHDRRDLERDAAVFLGTLAATFFATSPYVVID